MTAFGLSLALAALGSAAPEVHISLAGRTGEARAIALAMPPFIAEDTQRGAEALLAKQLRDVVRDDLLFSRALTVLEDGPHFDGANLKDIAPQWKARLAGCLLVAKVGAPVAADAGRVPSISEAEKMNGSLPGGHPRDLPVARPGTSHLVGFNSPPERANL